MSSYPTSAELAAFRERIGSDHRSDPLARQALIHRSTAFTTYEAGGAWPDELLNGIGYTAGGSAYRDAHDASRARKGARLIRSAAWVSPDGRWMIYQRDAAWIARDYSLPTDPSEHRRDQERAFYTWAECRAYISRQYQPSPWCVVCHGLASYSVHSPEYVFVADPWHEPGHPFQQA